MCSCEWRGDGGWGGGGRGILWPSSSIDRSTIDPAVSLTLSLDWPPLRYIESSNQGMQFSDDVARVANEIFQALRARTAATLTDE